MNISELKSLLSRFNIRPSKRLGQNFLLSENVLDKIVEAADLSKEDTVLEIGPGLGVLTRRLGERAGLVLAVEKDRRLVEALHKLFKSKKNVKIIQGDALEIFNFQFSIFNYKVVANIPYYLTGKLLQNFLSPNNPSQPPLASRGGVPPLKVRGGEGELWSRPSLIVLLLQKEVAERIVAKPGEMSILSVSVQLYGEPEIIDYVGKENFYPVPEVDSAILRIKVFDELRLEVNDKKFMLLVKIGFSNKRKMLANNLKNLRSTRLDSPSSARRANRYEATNTIDWKQTLASFNINPQARAQDLSLQDWKAIYDLTVD